MTPVALVVAATLVAMTTSSAATTAAEPPPATSEAEGTGQPGLLGEVIGGASSSRDGTPTSRYDIGYDPGAWNQVDRKVLGLGTTVPFEWVKLMTAASSATVGWAFDLDVAEGMAGQVDAVASRYDRSLRTGRISLYDLALFAAMAWCACALLRGRTVQAAGELVLSWLVLVGFGVFVVAVPGGFGRLVTGTVTAADGLSAAVVTATLDDEASAGCPAPSATTRPALACPFTMALHGAFVERPYDLLSWSRDLAAPSAAALAPCAAARSEILADGPHGTDDDPRNRMQVAGEVCQPLVAFNADPTAERMLVAWSMALVATLVLLLAGLVAATLIGAQLLLVGLVAVAPFAVLAGAVPGSGRALLWRWGAGLLKVLLVTVAMALFLALYLTMVNGLLDLTADVPWLAQAMTLVVATVAMFVVRGRLVRAAKSSADQAGRRLAAARVGGAHGSGGALLAAASWNGPGYRGLDPRRYVAPEVRRTTRDLQRARQWARSHVSRPNRTDSSAATRTANTARRPHRHPSVRSGASR